MSSRERTILNVVKSTLKSTYDPQIPKQPLLEDTIGVHIPKQLKMLNNIPPALSAFNEISREVVKNYEEEQNMKTSYDVVWLSSKLMGLYKGKIYKSYLSYDWELEADFYGVCESLLV